MALIKVNEAGVLTHPLMMFCQADDDGLHKRIYVIEIVLACQHTHEVCSAIIDNNYSLCLFNNKIN